MSDSDDVVPYDAPEPDPSNRRRTALVRIMAAIGFASAFLFGAYLLIDSTRPLNGFVSFTFLLILPAAICAFATYVADPFAERSFKFYITMPIWLLFAVILASVPILKEGVICVVILSPLWLISGMIGAMISYKMRSRAVEGRTYCTTLLLIPILTMQVEPMIPLPQSTATVSRSIVVNAAPKDIWPLLEGIPNVKPNEGRWNVTQDLLGVPRPLGAHLIGQGIGARRLANWGQQVQFSENITQWQPGHRLGWDFHFDAIEGWKFTDRHLLPDSPYFRITKGGYSLQPAGKGRTRITLDTSYWLKTPVNAYSRLWGEIFLGDLENNLLALVQQRAAAKTGS